MTGRRLHEILLIPGGRRHRRELLMLVHLMWRRVRARWMWKLMHIGLQMRLLALRRVRMIHVRGGVILSSRTSRSLDAQSLVSCSSTYLLSHTLPTPAHHGYTVPANHLTQDAAGVVSKMSLRT